MPVPGRSLDGPPGRVFFPEGRTCTGLRHAPPPQRALGGGAEGRLRVVDAPLRHRRPSGHSWPGRPPLSLFPAAVTSFLTGGVAPRPSPARRSRLGDATLVDRVVIEPSAGTGRRRTAAAGARQTRLRRGEQQQILTAGGADPPLDAEQVGPEQVLDSACVDDPRRRVAGRCWPLRRSPRIRLVSAGSRETACSASPLLPPSLVPPGRSSELKVRRQPPGREVVPLAWMASL